MSSYGVGSSANTGPGTPDFIDLNSPDLAKETVNNRITSTGYGVQGALLAKDTLDVPIENWGIFDSRSESSRPTLMPLIRTRFVSQEEFLNLSESYYQEIRNNLPPEMRRSLEQDEAQTYFEDRDPQWIAFDQALRFMADLQVIQSSMRTSTADNESAQLAAVQYNQLPQAVKDNLISYVNEVEKHLKDHLAEIGPNDPSYDMFNNALNQMAQVVALLKQPTTTT